MQTFDTTFELGVSVALDQRVIDVVNDEWRSQFYDLYTAQAIAEHIAYNMAKGRRLSQMDGFANLPDEWAQLVSMDWD